MKGVIILLKLHMAALSQPATHAQCEISSLNLMKLCDVLILMCWIQDGQEDIMYAYSLLYLQTIKQTCLDAQYMNTEDTEDSN